ESAEGAPLAQELFDYPFVDRVLFMSNFVTVTKKEDAEWIEIQSILKEHIKNYLEAGKYVIGIYKPEAPAAEEDTATVQKRKTIRAEYMRPAVEQDGGAITYRS